MADISFYEALDYYATSKMDLKYYPSLLSKIRAIKSHIPDGLLSEITIHTIDKHLVNRKTAGIANATIKHDIIQIRSAWKYARDRGYKVADIAWPTIKIDNIRIRALSRAEEKALLDELHPSNTDYCSELTPFNARHELQQQRQDNYDLVVLLIDTGARYSEIAKLTWDRVDFEAGTIHLVRTKTSNHTIVAMSKRARKTLKVRYHARKQARWVFTNKDGTGPRNYAVTAIRKAIQKAGIVDFRVHDLRHTHASRLVRNGLTIQETAKVLGHKGIQTTLRYAHLEGLDVARKAAAVMDLYS